MPPRGKTSAGLLTVIPLVLLAILAGPASAQIKWTHCGKVRSLGVEVLASKVSCRKAIRIVGAYEQSGLTRGRPKKVPGFPGWECSNGDRLGTCSRGSYARGAPMIDFPFLEEPGERKLGVQSGLDRGAELMADRSCGSVVVQGSLTYQLSIEKGSPSCGTVRRIAKKYGHPTSKKPRFYCSQKSYACEYSIYPQGWRCGGLFQGTFQCWHGANSPIRASEVFDATENPSARPLMRKSRDAFEFYAEEYGMPGLISFHGRLDIAGRAYPLAGRVVHVIFERQNAQGGFEPVPGEEYNATLNSAGEYSYRYWGIGHDTWHIRAVFYGTGDALGKSESETHTEVIKSGYRLMFRHSQKCLTTSENHTANGTMLIQWPCDSSNNPYDGQTFSLYPIDPPGSNHWQLRPNTAYGQCMDVYGASTANGVPLDLYQCTPGAANQVWSFPELLNQPGWFGGVALHSNKCMDVTGNNPANGVQIEQWDCIWSGNQQFAWLVIP